jgi:hypothetical protein
MDMLVCCHKSSLHLSLNYCAWYSVQQDPLSLDGLRVADPTYY